MANWFSNRSVMRFALVVIAGLLFIETFEFRQLEDAPFGPETWPRAVLILLAICAAIDAVKSSADKEVSQLKDVSVPLNWNRVAGFTACLGGYVAGMMVVGFPLATFAFCWAMLAFHGILYWKVCLSVSAGVTVVAVLLFLRVLYLSLPRGMWIFYDMTNFLLSFIGR